eukprot:scaffold437_cov288-Chaetoceros_neogracile.AAC.32
MRYSVEYGKGVVVGCRDGLNWVYSSIHPSTSWTVWIGFLVTHVLIATEVGMGAKALAAVIAQAARMMEVDLTILMSAGYLRE